MPKKFTYEQVRKVFEDRGCVLLSKEYQNAAKPLEYICSCGHQTTTRFANFKRGHKCTNCRAKIVADKRRTPIEKVRDIFKEGGCELVTTDYKNNMQRLEYVCECGRKSFTSLANFQKGVRCMECGLDKLRGENNYNWNPNKSTDTRNTPEYRAWRNAVLKRDEYTCQKCGEMHWAMTVHHVRNYSEIPELRYDVENGSSLCRPCHTIFHTQFGFTDNDGNQYLSFLTEMDVDPWYAGEVFDD